MRKIQNEAFVWKMKMWRFKRLFSVLDVRYAVEIWILTHALMRSNLHTAKRASKSLSFFTREPRSAAESTSDYVVVVLES